MDTLLWVVVGLVILVPAFVVLETTLLVFIPRLAARPDPWAGYRGYKTAETGAEAPSPVPGKSRLDEGEGSRSIA